MAKFQLNPRSLGSAHLHQPERVRIGSISLFALVIVICLAVLSVLALSTANASLTMSQRQATATTELYLDEMAAQEFLAGMDSILADGRTADAATKDEPQIEFSTNEWGNVAYDENGLMVIKEKGEKPQASADAAKAVEAALPDLCAAAQQAADNKVTATAQAFDNRIKADFSCQNGRTLNIVVTIRANGTYRIDKWKMSAVQNEEPPDGQYLIIDD